MRKMIFAGLLALAPSIALAEYPERLTRIVSPFSAGGGLDIVARVIGPRLSEIYKQPVIVDNRTGANGQIAIEYVAKAAPDGYTLLIDTLGFTVHPAVTRTPNNPGQTTDSFQRITSSTFSSKTIASPFTLSPRLAPYLPACIPIAL